MKKSSETEKTHTFFLKIGEEMMQKWMLFEVRHGVFEREKWGRQWTVTKIRGKKKKKKIFKTVFETQNTRFSQLIQVANQSLGHSPKHFKPKDLKNLLSVFRDWKSHSQGSYEISHENLSVPLATGPFTREQVTKIDSQARDCGMRLGWSATESPKQGNTIFELFSFCKSKILSKNT